MVGPSRSDADGTDESAWWRWLRRAFILFAMGFLILAGMLTLLQRKIIFPGTDIPATDSPRLPTAEADRWWLETDEGEVEAWFVPGDGAEASDPGPAVVLAHGNGELIDGYTHRVRPYVERGFSVLLPEYRGYGRSAGTPSQAAITDDFERFYDRFAEREEVDEERIAFHGFSLGGAALAALATRREPAAFILESTFTSVADMASWLPGASALISEPFDTLDVVEGLDVPMLVIHGERDEVIPFEHGERLAAANDRAEFVAHRGGHHAMTDQQTFWEAADRLFERAQLVKD